MIMHVAADWRGTGGWHSPRGSAVAVAALAVTAVLLAMAPPVAAQPVQWTGNGHYYQLVQDQVTFTAARAAAAAATYQGLIGHLATISSQEENDFIFGLVGGDDAAWIGFTDEVNEGTFLWVTAEPVGYTNWISGEPNDYGGEDYTEFVGYEGGQWNDVSNDNEGGRWYVVEYQESAMVPSLSVVGLVVLSLAVLALGVWRLR